MPLPILHTDWEEDCRFASCLISKSQLSALSKSTASIQGFSHICPPYFVTSSTHLRWFCSSDGIGKFSCPRSKADTHTPQFHRKKGSSKRFHSAKGNNF